MACLTCPQLNITKAVLRTQLRQSGSPKEPRLLCRSASPRRAPVKLPPLLATKNINREASFPYSSKVNGSSIINGNWVVEPIDSEEATEIPIFHGEQDVAEVKSSSFRMQLPLKWTMWLLGPSILLATGIVPSLFLPLAPIFPGANVAGLLSLVGLDCVFNMGAMLFLLAADACGRHKESSTSSAVGSRIPLRYKLWNIAASVLGFLVPLSPLLLLRSRESTLQLHLHLRLDSFMVVLGPYLLLLPVQMLTEMLAWHWRSPVWLVAPIVYEGYRVLQLMRGISFGREVGAPAWMVECVCGLVMWWVLVLGVQLMHVARFAGLPHRSES